MAIITSHSGVGSAQRVHRLARTGGGRQFQAQYAWFFMSNEERTAYTKWKNSSGDFGVMMSDGYMPKDWLLMEAGSVAGVAKLDVGMIGMGYLRQAQEAMDSGGTQAAWDAWVDTLPTEA